MRVHASSFDLFVTLLGVEGASYTRGVESLPFRVLGQEQQLSSGSLITASFFIHKYREKVI